MVIQQMDQEDTRSMDEVNIEVLQEMEAKYLKKEISQ